MPTIDLEQAIAALRALPTFTANTTFPGAGDPGGALVNPHDGFDTLASFMRWANAQNRAVTLNGLTVRSGMGPPLQFATTAGGRYEMGSSTPAPLPPISTPVPTPPAPQPPHPPVSGVRIVDVPPGWWANPTRLNVNLGQGTVAIPVTTGTHDSPANNPPHFTLAQFTGNPISHDVTLTSIAGAFWVNLMPAMLQGSTNTVHFTVGPNPHGYPALEHGRTYYINVRNTDPNGPASDFFLDFIKPQGDTY